MKKISAPKIRMGRKLKIPAIQLPSWLGWL
jgi:hypothetical protein